MGRKRTTTKLDIHLHTPSSDGRGTPAEYVKAIQKSGIDGICITDHHVSAGPESLAVQKAVRAAGFLCFMGCEYSTGNGHLLIYGVDVATLNLNKYQPMQDVIWAVRNAGGIAIPSHPFFGWKKKLGDDVYQMQDISGLETANGQLAVKTPYYNDDAATAANTLALPGIATSDAHHASRIGTCYTVFGGSIRRPSDFIRALNSGDFCGVTNNRRVAAQKRQVADWYGVGGLAAIPPSPFGGSESTAYSSGRGAYENPSQPKPWEQLYTQTEAQDEAEWEDQLAEADFWEAQKEAEALEGLSDEESGVPEAFRDPFFVGDEGESTQDAIDALDEWEREHRNGAPWPTSRPGVRSPKKPS